MSMRLVLLPFLLLSCCASSSYPPEAIDACEKFGGVRSYYPPEQTTVTTCADGAFFGSLEIAKCDPHGGIGDTEDMGDGALIFCNDGSLLKRAK